MTESHFLLINVTHKQKSKAKVPKSLEFRNVNLYVIYWQLTCWINYSSTSAEEPPAANAREPQGTMDKETVHNDVKKNQGQNPTANSRLI